jgi:hypothetical protein
MKQKFQVSSNHDVTYDFTIKLTSANNNKLKNFHDTRAVKYKISEDMHLNDSCVIKFLIES